MSYFDTYKARLNLNGGGVMKSIVNATANIHNSTFKEDISYREAYLNLDKNNKRDVRFIEDDSNQFAKYFITRPNESLSEGSYVTTSDGTFLVTSVKMNDLFPKAEALYCNQIFRITSNINLPVHINNTTYGVKGLKDNGTFKELDAKMKGYVQSNEKSMTLFEGMRILIPNNSKHFKEEIPLNKKWIAYEIIKLDHTVLEGLYVMEMQMIPLAPLDDLERGIAYNEGFNTGGLDYKIEGLDIVHIGKRYEYEIMPKCNEVVFELNDSCADIASQKNGICEIVGLSQGMTTLKAKINNNVVAEFNIMVF